jgi:S-adenosylmethionine synthetase
VSYVLVSTQHRRQTVQSDVETYVRETLAPRALGDWFNPQATFIVNPSGSFVDGGPAVDCGVTGRKIIVD